MSKKNYKAILFDLDGTLLDTLEDIGNGMNHVLEERNFPVHKLNAYRHFVGDGAAMLVSRTLPEERRDDEIIQECLEAFKKYYAQNWKVKTVLYEGVAEMLDAVTMRGLKIAVLSNKPHEFTVQCVTELLSNWKFNIVLGLRNSVPRKPDPAGAKEVARSLGLPQSQFLYVGDTAVDMQTANAAGMFSVGVLWGFRTRDELVDNGAKALVSHPLEILNLLG